MTTRPRSRNETLSAIRAWVPTTTVAWPEAIASWTRVPRLGLERAGQERDADPEVREQGPDGLDMLAGEQVGRGQERALEAGPRRRPRAHTPRPRSCPTRHRPGGAGASAWNGSGRRGWPPRRCSWSSVSSTSRPTRTVSASVRAARIAASAASSSAIAGDAARARCRRRATIPIWSASSSSNASRRRAASRPSKVSRVVGLLQRRGDAGQPLAAAEAVGQVLGVGVARAIERLADGGPQARGGQPGRQPVDRHDAAGMRGPRLPPRRPPGTPGCRTSASCRSA